MPSFFCVNNLTPSSLILLFQKIHDGATFKRMVEHYPKIFRQYLGAERAGSHEYPDETTSHAALIAGTSQSTSDAAKKAEPVSRKERAYFNEQVRPLEETALLAGQKLTISGRKKRTFSVNIITEKLEPEPNKRCI